MNERTHHPASDRARPHDPGLASLARDLDALGASDRAAAAPDLARRIAQNTQDALRVAPAPAVVAGRIGPMRRFAVWSGRIAAAVLIAGGIGLALARGPQHPGVRAEQQLIADLEATFGPLDHNGLADNTAVSGAFHEDAIDAELAQLESELSRLELSIAFGLSLETDDTDANF